MTDTLRTRIAAVLAQYCSFTYQEQGETWGDMGEVSLSGLADAVIRELSLTEDGGVIVGCAHE